MNILFTLCGRAGSKGFKNKNLKNFVGIPLIYYSIAAINIYKEKHQEHNIYAVLNTDSQELIDIVTKVKNFDVSVIHRDSELGGDSVPKVSVIADCLKRSETNWNIEFDMVVDLDITSPLRTLGDVENTIKMKAMRNDVDVIYSVTESRRNPFFNMVKQENGFFVKAIKSDFTARQQAPSFYDMNASIYAYSIKALKEKPHTTFFNDKCDAIIMKDTGILDIDSEEDYELMQVIAKHIYSRFEEFSIIRNRALLFKTII